MLATLMLALLAVGITTIMLSAQASEGVLPRDLRALAQHTPPTRPTDGAVPTGRTVKAAEIAVAPPADQAPAAQNEPTGVSSGTPPAPGLAVGQRARVANTDGVGVVLYAAPDKSARRPAGLLEGTAVTVLELADSDWARVQSDARQSGWVHAAFLAAE
jgi:hypothetical protein